MIRSFSGKEKEKIWEGIQSKKLPADIQNAARRKLRMINNSQNINDLRIPPANHLEKLSGNLSEFHSIRTNTIHIYKIAQSALSFFPILPQKIIP